MIKNKKQSIVTLTLFEKHLEIIALNVDQSFVSSKAMSLLACKK